MVKMYTVHRTQWMQNQLSLQMVREKKKKPVQNTRNNMPLNRNKNSPFTAFTASLYAGFCAYYLLAS